MLPTYLIIHHSDTEDGPGNNWDAIRTYHKNHNGWTDIGYHYGIERIGDRLVVQTGRAETAKGAHCAHAGMNDKSLGICLVGDFDKAPPSSDVLAALVVLVKGLMKKYRIPIKNVLGHWEAQELELPKAVKSCPGNLFDMNSFRRSLV